jgi:hypothetical protein
MATKTVGSSSDRQRALFHVTYKYLSGDHVNADIWICHRPAKLLAIRENHSVVSTSGTLRFRKITDTSAPGAAASATVIELTSATLLTSTVINTIQTITPTTTPNLVAGVTQFQQGDRLAQISAGTVGTPVGVIVFTFQAM